MVRVSLLYCPSSGLSNSSVSPGSSGPRTRHSGYEEEASLDSRSETPDAGIAEVLALESGAVSYGNARQTGNEARELFAE